jgi:NAD(P)-dependent dehydrogenase (short-subunit alcohol dehydrogenase family)
MTEFDRKIVVVTGASSGIGLAAAEAFARQGALVALFARTKETLESIAERHGAGMLAIAGDVALPDDIERLFTEVETRFGDCDVLVNCAGMIDPKPLLTTTTEAWNRMFAVNMGGTFLAARRALPGMVARRSGTIVNVASISGVPGPRKFPGFASYNASKAAVIAFTEALAVETKDLGVRVNCVSPGSVDTGMWAAASGGAPAAMTAGEVAESILFLASERSRPMNGQNLDLYGV